MTGPLRVTWAPHGDVAGADDWRPTDAAMSPVDDTVRVGPGVEVRGRAPSVTASWPDGDPRPYRVTAEVTVGRFRIAVPPVWQAQVHLGWRDGRLLVCSDLRTLARALRTTALSHAGIAAFLAHGGRAGDGVAPAVYQGIWTVQPGHTATVALVGPPRYERTWRPELDPDFAARPLPEVVDRLRADLDDAVERVLARYGSVACLFSGGLDSSLVAAALLRRAPDRVAVFNAGSSLGTAEEIRLRDWCRADVGVVSTPVDLPADAGLVQALRAVNAVSDRPTGSPFTAVFEHIIAAARERGYAALVTGDGGDEVFTEREDVLVDLLAARSPTLPAAVGYFALRNGERGTATLCRATRELSILTGPVPPRLPSHPGDVLFGPELARHVADARRSAADHVAQLWRLGWPRSAIGSWQRATAVPEWEPAAAAVPGFPVASPLVDERVVADALILRRDAVLPLVCGGRPKWLLRQAALHWLPARVAMHPKIGSADGQLLAGVRTREHGELLALLGSDTARRADLHLPRALHDPRAALWVGDDWIRAAALVAWLDTTALPPPPRPTITVLAPPTATPMEPAATGPPAGRAEPARPWRVVVLVLLNLAAQAMPGREPMAPTPGAGPTDDALRDGLLDLTRRACAVPFVDGATRPMSRALAWYLRLGGQPAAVVRGRAQGDRRLRYWVHTGNTVVDVGCAETPLEPDVTP